MKYDNVIIIMFVFVLYSRSVEVASICDERFFSNVTRNGSLTSPRYPEFYPPNIHCKYTFKGVEGERIQIAFNDIDLYTSDNVSCVYDDVIRAIETGPDGMPAEIGTFCGSQIALPIMSSGRNMVLEFLGSHSSVAIRGFKAHFTFLQNYGIISGQQNRTECVFYFQSTLTKNGTISSPNFPGPYPRATECHYLFYGDLNEKIRIDFIFFNIEGIYPCDDLSESDYVELSNYPTRDRKFNRICGKQKRFQIQSDERTFRILFKSNNRFDGTGFQAFYQFYNETIVSTMTAIAVGSPTVEKYSLLLIIILFLFII